jgi:diguanylate cyclase (GGDEF)-like protein
MSKIVTAQTPMCDFQWSNETSLFERALDCLPDGVLLVRDASTIVYANQAFEKIWNVPDGVITSKDDSALLPWVASQVANTAAFIGEVKRLYHSSESSEDIVPLKDGLVISRRSVPLKEEGAIHTRIWIFTNITEARHARIDAITGLPNRRAYANEYPGFALSGSDGLTRSVAIMDIDNFKSYNDTYGHAAGDEVLRRIGATLRTHMFRSDDLVFRIGGEEFLLACKFRQRSSVVAFYEEIRASVQLENIEHCGNAPFNCVTSSFGIGVTEGPAEPDIVFKSADASLYRAKASARNKLVVDYIA